MVTDFDFLLGRWKVINHRLKTWLSNCDEWVTFESTHIEQRHSSGIGNFAYHQYVLDHALCERSVLRSYDSKFDHWKIERLDTASHLQIRPLLGTFWSNKGSFLSTGVFEGQSVLVWAEWTRICNSVACWEQALSNDAGKTWELCWQMEFFKKN